MDKLKTDKRYLKASLTKLKGTLESKEFGIDSAEVTLYTNKVADLESKCSDIFSKIYYDCQEEEIDGYISESQDIQDIIDGYKLIVLRARDRLELENTEAKKVVPRETKQSSGGLNLSLKLPEFNIPSFSGSSNLEWLSFRDLFSASVVKNQNLSDAQRLQYLVGSVKGDALRVIQSLPITDSNFQIAWDLLEERVCHKKHNTLLHFESTNSADSARVLSPHAAEFVPGSVNEPTPVPQQTLTNVSSCVSHQSPSIQVLLCTAIVKVLDSSNQFQYCRVLLDPGSQACFVTESCLNRLGLARTRARVEISCLGSSSAHTNGVTNLKFTPHFKESPEFVTSAFIINKIIGSSFVDFLRTSPLAPICRQPKSLRYKKLCLTYNGTMFQELTTQLTAVPEVPNLQICCHAISGFRVPVFYVNLPLKFS
ncbi:hypothetical protein JTE90_008107 [Oedothorax gibbosus]|uniref:Peptidase aspartic putative domain-containing protein n=1 Tax=Oedothorax gibbosus TaxID=931172 RepID=A0AAV6V2G1_9ARAC|nr:hypothetical protein JTE90_008107 [Oedothorax gibbosus]